MSLDPWIVGRTSPPAGRIRLNSDHGSQYTSKDVATLCKELGVTQSMCAVGTSADNSLAESFNAALKREVLQYVEIRDRESLSELSLEWDCATTNFLSQAVPWRTFPLVRRGCQRTWRQLRSHLRAH